MTKRNSWTERLQRLDHRDLEERSKNTEKPIYTPMFLSDGYNSHATTRSKVLFLGHHHRKILDNFLHYQLYQT